MIFSIQFPASHYRMNATGMKFAVLNLVWLVQKNSREASALEIIVNVINKPWAIANFGFSSSRTNPTGDFRSNPGCWWSSSFGETRSELRSGARIGPLLGLGGASPNVMRIIAVRPKRARLDVCLDVPVFNGSLLGLDTEIRIQVPQKVWCTTSCSSGASSRSVVAGHSA